MLPSTYAILITDVPRVERQGTTSRGASRSTNVTVALVNLLLLITLPDTEDVDLASVKGSLSMKVISRSFAWSFMVPRRERESDQYQLSSRLSMSAVA